ncbi:VOC family protein [Pseudonocardia humida]|uniref:VOC family protein n=1 Tax=Pseudonocardia humida TaxID=2800819 RepID=A0ABT1AC76_9PSEU|nr:VOC family protein [Pseudonocardia humida]MCO1660655.1 VOC family protein [Pseudonocardia humida]
MRTLRIRQVAVAAADRDAVSEVWRRELGLGEPFHDPVVDRWGLHNAVFPVGDAFLEVVSPHTPGAGSPAERHMARQGGDCGYMAIFQVDDLDDGRRVLAANGMRSVLDVDHDDIRSTHVHPADVGAAIISLDQPVPPSSWRWGGPGWAQRARAVVADGIAGVRLVGPDPGALLERWARALAVEPRGDRLVLDDRSTVTVGPGERAGLVGVDLWAAPGAAQVSFQVAGTRFRSVRR